jgi:hypothetical protein
VRLKSIVSVYQDRQADARNSAFWCPNTQPMRKLKTWQIDNFVV